METINLETGEQAIEALLIGQISREEAIKAVVFLDDITEDIAEEIFTELGL